MVHVGNAKQNSAPLKVLVVLPFKGYFARTGSAIHRGITIGLRMYQKDDPNVDLHLVPTSDQLQEIAKQTEIEIETYKPDLIIGGVTSVQALSIGMIAERKQISFLAPYATNPALTQGKKFIFTMCFNDSAQAKGLSRITDQQKPSKDVMVLYSKGDIYSEFLKNEYVKNLPQKFKIIEKAVDVSKPLPEDVLKDAKRKEFQFFFMPFYQMSALSLISQILKVRPTGAIFLGPDSWAVDSSFITKFKEFSLGSKAIYVDHWNPNGKSNYHVAVSKLTDLEEREAMKLTGGALGFDIGLLLTKISAKNKILNLRNSILQSRIQGLTGATAFEQHNVPHKDLHFFEIGPNGNRFITVIQHL